MRCWELEGFWEEVEREIAALDPLDLEAFRSPEPAGPEPDAERVARLRRRLCGSGSGAQ